ncbi:hypothetical protein IEQ34_022559 [Dendrobium chrysotoxum]|uniref:DUF1771 domain-containing protein n=1 Tax=Dendrobium chrysotoxum TaxID=161865 RepID=A0AAV7FZC4_DENCH|nr:hypothetical protein IEQ34_022559 [Dendrobium chrysotoxum]
MQPVAIGIGEAVTNLYSSYRVEARDFTLLQNAFFQQAREAYLIGNKALAKDLDDKGKWYKLQIVIAPKISTAVFESQENEQQSAQPCNTSAPKFIFQRRNAQIVEHRSINSIDSILRLSYMVLPKYLQNCFAFCCMFPQDQQFGECDVVLTYGKDEQNLVDILRSIRMLCKNNQQLKMVLEESPI